ncbi:hypothetical protein B0H21DRAFT_760511 [Amylocystis lapponica]|nr:hypothetical protein B0H21DRAFT_760511 [Amylocystis lapponica]
MADPHAARNPASPISQLLRTIGLTRSDLTRHSEQMRQFLGAEAVQALPLDGSQPDERDPFSSRSHSRGRSRANSVANASAVAQSPILPATPIKPEPVDDALPPRQLDTMQLVMERKRREKKDRRNSNARERDARRVQAPSSAAPSRSGTPLQATPTTPHHYKYYSERVVGEASTSQSISGTTPNPVIPQTPSRHRSVVQDGQFKIPGPLSSNPRTPSRHNNHAPSRTSTPCSSPVRIVNIVSSPGPMSQTPLADEEDEDELPYVLPPGPYYESKPDFSYAGIIGQAILASPEHRLTLQHIYEWITTVYPFYKRGEQTWMNSVRHALSTMAVFRKVPRGRAEGKSLWAIWDCDMGCFAGGGFRKTLCADMMNKVPSASKSAAKKRGAATMEEALSRKPKRRKQLSEVEESDPLAPAQTPPQPTLPAVLPPFFPPFHSNPHHQPYYQAYGVRPAEVIFPPLPPSSNYHRVNAMSASASSVSRSESVESRAPLTSMHEDSEDESASSRRGREPSPKTLTYPKAYIPDLTPNCSSSSSPPPSSRASIADLDTRQSPSPIISRPATISDTDEEADALERDWLKTIPSADALAPSVTLHDHRKKKSRKVKPPQRKRQQPLPSLPMPVSPTLDRSLFRERQQQRASRNFVTPPPPSLDASRVMLVPTTPPKTPPRRTQVIGSGGLSFSPLKTPLSHKGLHMSPSPSLAHYKSNLDPPPAAVFLPQAPLLNLPTEGHLSPIPQRSPVLRTPSRRRTAQSASGSYPNISPFAPVTPKRLFSNAFESPSRHWDPHDPSVLLDEELSRLGAQPHGLGESPSGLFGKMSGLLYESPNGTSPRNWDRYW